MAKSNFDRAEFSPHLAGNDGGEDDEGGEEAEDHQQHPGDQAARPEMSEDKTSQQDPAWFFCAIISENGLENLCAAEINLYCLPRRSVGAPRKLLLAQGHGGSAKRSGTNCPAPVS